MAMKIIPMVIDKAIHLTVEGGGIRFTTCYVQASPILIVIKGTRKPYRFRLASDMASAVQQRRVKAIVGVAFDRIPELSAADMASKVNELLAEAIAGEIDRQLLGESK